MHPHNIITFDDSLWPLLVVRMSGTPTHSQFEEYLAARGSFLERGEKHVLVYDAARFNVLSNEQRQRQVEWLKEREAVRRDLTLGSALIITSPLVRLTLNIVRYFNPTTTPYFVASSMDEAVKWAAARLDEAGLHEQARRVRESHGLIAQRGTG